MAKCMVTKETEGEGDFLTKLKEDCSGLHDKFEERFEVRPCEEIFRKYIELKSDNEALVQENLILFVGDKCTFLKKGSKLKYFLIEANEISLRVVEGQTLDRWQVVAFTFSKKGIIRKVKIPFSGKLVFIFSDPISKPERYVLLLTPSPP